MNIRQSSLAALLIVPLTSGCGLITKQELCDLEAGYGVTLDHPHIEDDSIYFHIDGPTGGRETYLFIQSNKSDGESWGADIVWMGFCLFWNDGILKI